MSIRSTPPLLPVPPPSAELLAAVAAAPPVATRRPARTLAGVVLMSLACAGSLLVLVIGLRRDVGTLPVTPLVLYAAVCLISFGAHLALALLPAPGQVLPDVSRSARLSMVMTALTVPLGLLVGVTFGDPSAGPHHHAGARAASCLTSGFLVAAVPATLALLALRRIIPMGAWRAALAVGGAAGVLAGLTLELHCPFSGMAHLGLAHGTVMVAPALLLALLGARLLTRR